MVTKEEKSKVSQFTRDIARIIKGRMAEEGVTQTQIALAISRSQAYVSERVNGLDAWNTHELSVLSDLLGYEDTFQMMRDLGVRLGR